MAGTGSDHGIKRRPFCHPYHKSTLHSIHVKFLAPRLPSEDGPEIPSWSSSASIRRLFFLLSPLAGNPKSNSRSSALLL